MPDAGPWARDVARKPRRPSHLHRGTTTNLDPGTREDASGGDELSPRDHAELVLDRPGLDLLDAIAAGAADTLDAAIFFGSRSSGVATNSASAYDLMLICARPADFYRAMSGAGFLHRSAALLGLLDGLLPPTQIRLVHGGGLVKASVLSMAALQRATSPARKDQFVAGRLFQDVHVVWARGPESLRHVDDAIASARRVTLDWVAPDLPDHFAASDYARQLFRTSFRFEVRPEARGRADSLFEAQAARLVPMFAGVLCALAAEGRLRTTDDRVFSLPQPASRGEVLRRRLYLEWSRVRATARWPKHAVTFDGWLDYIIRKAERHSGETIILSPMERRFPLILMWPRVFKFLARQRGNGRPV